MALISRITQLVRANLNDLVDRAEDPEKMIKQVILDMEEELKLLKSQIAVAMADKHLLEKKSKENRDRMSEWLHKAELCVSKDEEPLARSALERYIGYQQLAGEFEEQSAEQDKQVEDLKGLLQRLEQKITEARSTGELLMAQHRRARTLEKVSGSRTSSEDSMKSFDQFRQKILHSEAVGRSRIDIGAESAEHKIETMEKNDKVDKLLSEIKERRKPSDKMSGALRSACMGKG